MSIKKISEDLLLGSDGEIISLKNYQKGWNELDIPPKFKTKENRETYCYLQYCGLDAEQILFEHVKKTNI